MRSVVIILYAFMFLLLNKKKEEKKNVDKIKEFIVICIVLCAQTILLSYFMEKLLIRQEKKTVLFS